MTRTTPLQNDFHTQKPNFVTQKNDEGKKQGGFVFCLCGGYCDIWTVAVGEKLVCQTEEVRATDLDFDSFGAPVTASLASCIVPG